MSRIGKQPIQVPDSVNVTIDGGVVTVKGPKGELSQKILPRTTIKDENGQLVVSREGDEGESRAFHGLMRSLVYNMVVGVSEGFTKELEINGVGYKASISGKTLNLKVGLSHDINYNLPEGIDVEVQGNNIKVSGHDKQLVGSVAAKIRSFRKPEPYKGKGIKYVDEYIVRKAGKTATGAGA